MYKGPEWEAKSRHQDKQGGMHQESCVCFGMGLGVGGASPVALVVKNPSANAGDTGDACSSLCWEDPLERKWQPTPVYLPGESHGQRSLVGYSP